MTVKALLFTQYRHLTIFSTIVIMWVSSLTAMRRSVVMAASSSSSSSTRRLHSRLAFVSKSTRFQQTSKATPSSSASLFIPNTCHPSINRPNTFLAPTFCNTDRRLSSLSSSSSSQDSSVSTAAEDGDGDGFFASQDVTFGSIGVQSPVLLERLHNQLGLTRPTQIQAKAFAKIRGAIHEDDTDAADRRRGRRVDVTIGAETGSGKTLAYLIPLIDDILMDKAKRSSSSNSPPSYDYARAVILVPNKELVQQVLRMAVPLCGGTVRQSVLMGASSNQNLWEQLELLATNRPGQGDEPDPDRIVRLAVLPGGLNEPLDFRPFRDAVALGGTDPPVDIVITTPAALGPLGLKPKYIDMFGDIRTLVVDEADMLLDGGYIRSLENILMGFRRADRLDTGFMDGAPKTQHIFCAATLPDMGLKSVDAYLQRKFPYAARIQTDRMHNARHYGLAQATQWNMVETKKERMEKLQELLETDVQDGGLKGEKVMVFLNSVEDVEGAHEALIQRGIEAVPYHAKVSLDDRSKNLDRFRRYSHGNTAVSDESSDAVSVLVCTDLASRGLDVPGVTAVVQLQFSGNVVSHLHRMGRCGRAGQRTGRGIVFFNEAEADLVEVVKEAEAQQERMQLKQDVLEEDEATEVGKVKNAFSRKRGFTKKRKKERREGGATEP